MNIRKATRQDLPEIVRLLADDTLGSKRERYEDPLPPAYYLAFQDIEADPNSALLVAEVDNKIVGTVQLTVITYLSHQGSKRGLIESVRIDKNYRHQGLGKQMLEWVIDKARAEGCTRVELTSDKQREDALSFYQSLGFVPSHEGMKLTLS